MIKLMIKVTLMIKFMIKATIKAMIESVARITAMHCKHRREFRRVACTLHVALHAYPASKVHRVPCTASRAPRPVHRVLCTASCAPRPVYRGPRRMRTCAPAGHSAHARLW